MEDEKMDIDYYQDLYGAIENEVAESTHDPLDVLPPCPIELDENARTPEYLITDAINRYRILCMMQQLYFHVALGTPMPKIFSGEFARDSSHVQFNVSWGGRDRN